MAGLGQLGWERLDILVILRAMFQMKTSKEKLHTFGLKNRWQLALEPMALGSCCHGILLMESEQRGLL